MNRTARADIAALVLAIAVVIGLAVALRPAATDLVTADPATVSVDRPPLEATDEPPSMLLIGDSYAVGNGLKEMSYGCMAAVRMGWLCDLSAMSGTGYIAGGGDNSFDTPSGPSQSFAERIPQLALTYQPDIVILDGGRNDLYPPPENVINAMAGTIGEARRAWPHATIVFIRPRFLANPDDDLGFDDAAIADLERHPDTAGVVFVDPLARLTGRDTSAMLRPDGVHPNQEGNQEISTALLDALSASRLAAST